MTIGLSNSALARTLILACCVTTGQGCESTPGGGCNTDSCCSGLTCLGGFMNQKCYANVCTGSVCDEPRFDVSNSFGCCVDIDGGNTAIETISNANVCTNNGNPSVVARAGSPNVCDPQTCGPGKRYSCGGTGWTVDGADLPGCGSVECSDCLSGRYRAESLHTETSCSLCEAGKYQGQTGSSSCIPCADGKTSSQGSTYCSSHSWDFADGAALGRLSTTSNCAGGLMQEGAVDSTGNVIGGQGMPAMTLVNLEFCRYVCTALYDTTKNGDTITLTVSPLITQAYPACECASYSATVIINGDSASGMFNDANGMNAFGSSARVTLAGDSNSVIIDYQTFGDGYYCTTWYESLHDAQDNFGTDSATLYGQFISNGPYAGVGRAGRDLWESVTSWRNVMVLQDNVGGGDCCLEGESSECCDACKNSFIVTLDDDTNTLTMTTESKGDFSPGLPDGCTCPTASLRLSQRGQFAYGNLTWANEFLAMSATVEVPAMSATMEDAPAGTTIEVLCGASSYDLTARLYYEVQEVSFEDTSEPIVLTEKSSGAAAAALPSSAAVLIAMVMIATWMMPAV